MKKLSLDDLLVDSFSTSETPEPRGTVAGHQRDLTEATHCWGMSCEAHTGCTGGESLMCPQHTNEYPCTWEPQLMCATNEIAYPSECTGCGQICNPTADHCYNSYPVWNC